MATVSLKEQTFLGSTEIKVVQVIKMRGFLLVLDRSCRAESVGSAVVPAGLSLVSKEYQWLFHGDTVRYDSEGTPFQVDRSILALLNLSLTLKSIFGTWLALTFLAQ